MINRFSSARTLANKCILRNGPHKDDTGGAGGAGVFTDEEFDARVKEFEEKFKIIGAAYDALMQGKNHIT